VQRKPQRAQLMRLLMVTYTNGEEEAMATNAELRQLQER
jgi:hypothetical protein